MVYEITLVRRDGSLGFNIVGGHKVSLLIIYYYSVVKKKPGKFNWKEPAGCFSQILCSKRQ